MQAARQRPGGSQAAAGLNYGDETIDRSIPAEYLLLALAVGPLHKKFLAQIEQQLV